MSEIQISKTLLILKSNSNSTLAAEQFLRNREWAVFSTTNLKDFLTYIIQKKPSFVMISVDHPNKKVLMMPKVLTQSFPVCVFVFAEQSSSVSFRKLQDVQCNYRINPPATGPAIERMVNKYLRDQEKKMKEEAEKPTTDASGKTLAADESKTTVIQHGGASSDAGSISAGGGNWNQAASVLSQLLEGDDSVKADKVTGDGSGIARTLSGRGDKADGNNGAWVPSEGDNSKDPGFAGAILGGSGPNYNGAGGDFSNEVAGGFLNGQGGSSGTQKGSGTSGSLSGGKNSSKNGLAQGVNGDGALIGNDDNNKQPGQLNSGGNANKKAGHFAGGDYSAEDDSINPKQNGSMLGSRVGADSNGHAGQLNSGVDKKKGSGKNGDPNYNEKDFDDDGQPHKLGRDPQNLPVRNLRAPNKYTKEQKIHTILGKGKTGADSYDSIILKGTKQALNETVEILDGEINQQLEDSSQVACIVVESARFNGYLIAALGKNRKMDGNFIKAIQEKLFKFLNDNGEKIADKSNINLKIKKVEFEDWAVEYADFLKKSVHHGEEIAMAFFPVVNAKTEVGESASTTMASVKLSEMEGDKVVEFNMYLFMPINKKYILYTPKGSKFYANQKSRLTQKGVKEVHMLKSEVNDLSKYKAQNYLNNLIDGYKNKKASVKPSAA